MYVRIAGEQPRIYPALGMEWRKAGGKIRVSAASTKQSDEDYLTKLVAAMIAEDTIGYGVNESLSTTSTQNLIRILPSISEDFTNPKVKVYKYEFVVTTSHTNRVRGGTGYTRLYNTRHWHSVKHC